MSWISDIKASRATLPAFMAEGIAFGTFAAYAPDLKARIGADDGTYGLVLLGMATVAMAGLVLAPLPDRWLGRYAMPFAAMGLILAAALMANAGSIWVILAALLLMGGFAGMHDVIMNARLSAVEAAKGASLMNLNHGFFSLAYAAAALVSGYAREAGVSAGQMYLIWMGGIACLSLLMIQAPQIGRTGKEDNGGAGIGALAFWGGVIILIAFLAENAAESWSALHIERSLGGSASQGATGPAMLGLTMAIGRLFGQVLIHRWPEALLLQLASVIAAGGAVLAASAHHEWVAYLGFGVLGLGVSVVAPVVLALVGRRVSDGARTLAISRVSIVGYSGFFFGPPLMGFAAEGFGLPVAFGVVGALLLSIPLFLVGLRRITRIQDQPAE